MVRVFFLLCAIILPINALATSPHAQLRDSISLNKQVLILPTILQNYFVSLSKRSMVERIDKGTWRFSRYSSGANALDTKNWLPLGLRVDLSEDAHVQKSFVTFFTDEGHVNISFFCEKKTEEEMLGTFAALQEEFEGTHDFIFADILKLNPSKCRTFLVNAAELKITIKVENTPTATFGGFVKHFTESSPITYQTSTFFDDEGVLRKYHFFYPPHSNSLLQARLNNDKSVSFWVEGEQENFEYFNDLVSGTFDSGLKSSAASQLIGYALDAHFPMPQFISYQRKD